MTDPSGVNIGPDGVLRSTLFDDIYFSREGGLEESREVFLKGCHLPEGFGDHAVFRVLELGFGTGLNILALMDLWSIHAPKDAHLEVFSIEAFLLSRSLVKEALSPFSEVSSLASRLLKRWPAKRRGLDYIDFDDLKVRLTLAQMPVDEALGLYGGGAHCVFLDGFSPSKNPQMWTPGVLGLVGSKTAPAGRLATFTVAGAVRDPLMKAGFSVYKTKGFGRKRHRLEAIKSGLQSIKRTKPQRLKVAIIGGGIAGGSVCYQMKALGHICDIFDPAPFSGGASHNEAALVTPRIDMGSELITGLYADALMYARGLYHKLAPQAIIHEGVINFNLHKKGSSANNLIGKAEFPVDEFSWIETSELNLQDRTAIGIKSALALRPIQLLEALFEEATFCATRVLSIQNDLRLELLGGEITQAYDRVILCAGVGNLDLAESEGLSPVRGQLEVAKADTDIKVPLTGDGYLVPLDQGVLFGSTHQRHRSDTDVSDEDRAYNLNSLMRLTQPNPLVIDKNHCVSRASVRVATRDYWPVIGGIEEGVFALTGLGSRGFCLAPLLARWLCQMATGAEVDMKPELLQRLSPQRKGVGIHLRFRHP